MEVPFQILIVEDNASFALEGEMLIKNTGYGVMGIVDNADEALELISAKKRGALL